MMKFNGTEYYSNKIGEDFVFSVMWHVSPKRELSVLKQQDVLLAVNNSYRDMMPRTIDGLGLSKLDDLGKKYQEEKKILVGHKERLLNELRETLADKITSVFNNKEFNDKIHKKLCNDFLDDFKKRMNTLNEAIRNFNSKNGTSVNEVDINKITYGKAQKIVNMTMEHLYCFDDAPKYIESIFINCHIPIDSIIIDFFNGKQKGTKAVWSNLDEEEYYKLIDSYRKAWKEKIPKTASVGLFEHLFFAEFVIWDAANSNRHKKNIDTFEIGV